MWEDVSPPTPAIRKICSIQQPGYWYFNLWLSIELLISSKLGPPVLALMHFAFVGYIRESNLQHQRVKNVYFTEQAISSLLVKLQLNYTQINKVHMFNSKGPSKLQIGNSTNSYSHGIWGTIPILIQKPITSNCCTLISKIKTVILKATVLEVKYSYLLAKRWNSNCHSSNSKCQVPNIWI